MRKLLFICLMAVSVISSSQIYVGAGTSVSGGELTYGAEAGYYNENVALGIGDEFTPGVEESNYVSFKMYGFMASFGQFSIYDYAAMKVNVQDCSLVAETGPVVYFTRWRDWYPQASWTFSFSSDNPITGSIGVGINYLW